MEKKPGWFRITLIHQSTGADWVANQSRHFKALELNYRFPVEKALKDVDLFFFHLFLLWNM